MTTLNNTSLLVLCALSLLISATIILMLDVNELWFIQSNQAVQILPAWFWANATLIADTLFAVAMILIAASYRPALFSQGLVLLILGAVFVHTLKPFFGLSRPAGTLDHELFYIIGPTLKYQSFPSGHAFTAMATVGLLMLHSRTLWLTLALLAIGLIAAFSRVAVGAHWPLDVLVGGGFGLLIALLAAVLYQHIPALHNRYWKAFAAAIMTLATVALLFHDDRYPDTQGFGIVVGLIALLCVTRQIWWPLWQHMRSSQ